MSNENYSTNSKINQEKQKLNENEISNEQNKEFNGQIMNDSEDEEENYDENNNNYNPNETPNMNNNEENYEDNTNNYSQNETPNMNNSHSNPTLNNNNNSNININSNENIITSQENTINQSLSFEKLKILLTEKDEKILQYQKKQKELINIVSKLQMELSKKQEDIIQYEQRTKTLENFMLSNKNNLDKKNEELLMLSNENIFKYNELQKGNNMLLGKINDLQNILSDQEKIIQENNSKNQQNMLEIEKLQKSIEDKDNILIKSEDLKNFLNDENKKIPFLKQRIDELEEVHMNFQEENEELKEECDKLNFEKEELIEKLNKKIKECSKDKINETNLFNLTCKFENLSKDLQNKIGENKKLIEKNKIISKDSDNFLHIFTQELGSFLNYLESQNISTKIELKIPISTLPNYSGTSYGKGLEFKFEILFKFIKRIKEKMIEIINNNINSINKLNTDILTLEEKNKNLNNDIETNKKDTQILKDNLNQSFQEIHDSKNNYLKTISDYQQLQKEDKKLKSNLDDLKKENENIIKKYTSLIKSIEDKLSNAKIGGVTTAASSLSSTPLRKGCNDKLDDYNSVGVLNQINTLINYYYDANKKLNALTNKNYEFKAKMDKINGENMELKNKINVNDQSMNEQLVGLKNDKENELNNQKQFFISKIKALNLLLEESNKVIKSYESEVTQLKTKNQRLENNIQLLTNSHSELEKIIKSSNTGMQNEIDKKEQNNNELVKELELKNLHIKSLEKLLVEKNPLDIKKNNENNIVEDIKDNNNNVMNESMTSFVKDSNREMELNKMIFNMDMTQQESNINNTNKMNNMKNKIQPQPFFSDNCRNIININKNENVEEELRNIAKQQNNNEHIKLPSNQSLRCQIFEGKNIVKEKSSKSKNKKVPGKIFIQK